MPPPGERPNRRDVIAPNALMNIEPEAEPVARAPLRKERVRLIARHQHHGVRRQNSHTVELASVGDHLQEARVVARG